MPYKKVFASFFIVCKLVDMKLASRMQRSPLELSLATHSHPASH